jgi:hypothetical protein
VLLINSGGSNFDADTPVYARGTVTFSDGVGTAAFSSFTPVVSDPLPAGTIAYSATADGSATAGTTKIDFVFNTAPSGLSVGDISISGTGAATKGTLTGSGTNWSLAITVTTAGQVTVSINKGGIDSSPKFLTLYKPDITYTATADGSATVGTTKIDFVFSANIDSLNLSANDISISGTGTATKGTLTGSGTSRSLAITVTTAGSVTVSINKSGIESAPKTVTLHKLITYTATQNGNENVTSTAITFTFSEAVSGLSANDISISGSGAATKGTLTGSGANWILSVTVTTAGSITVSVNKSGVESAGQVITLYKTSVLSHWAAVTNSTFDNSNIKDVAFGGGKFVAVGNDGKMAYSTDGQIWTAVTNSTFGTSNIRDAAFGGGKFVAVGDDGKMAYSTDGVSWTAITNSTFDSSNNISAVVYGDGKWVVSGNKVAYSTDLNNWTAVAGGFFGAAYGDGRFVAGGGGVGSPSIGYSTDGANWTQVTVAWTTFENTIYGIAYGDGTFIAVGLKGQIMGSSNNGEYWWSVYSPFLTSQHLYGVAYGNGKFVAAGVSGGIAYSTDGSSWTVVTNSAVGGNTISGVAYGNGKWVAVGDGGKIAYSNPQE